MLHLVATEFRRDGTVRDEALDLLNEALGLGGWDGAEHRAIIAPRLPFLRHVAPEWVESREPRLLGDEDPESLGQKDRGAGAKVGALRARLDSEGRRLDEPDLRIASIALSRGLIVVTANVPRFGRVPDLKVENWLTA